MFFSGFMICLSKTPVVIPRENQVLVRFPRPQLDVRKRKAFGKLTRYVPKYSLVLRRSRAQMAKAVDTSSSSFMLTSGASGRVNALCSLRVWRSVLMLINAFVLLFMLPFRARRKGPSSSRKDEKHEESGGTHHRKSGSGDGPVVRVPAKMVPRRKRGVVEQEVATRRALAIRRVSQDDGGDDNSVREYTLFVTARGATMFTQAWTPVSVKIR